MKEKAWFKDIYDERPFHYDCTLGKLKLPWNNEVIDIFINYDVQNRYRPVVGGLYAEEMSNIYLKGESFSEEDLSVYIQKVKDYNQHTELIRKEKMRVLLETGEMLKKQIDSSMHQFVKVLDRWILICSKSYALDYDPETKTYEITKYKADTPFERRFYWWNVDKSFLRIKSDNRNEIVKQFADLIAEELAKQKSE